MSDKHASESAANRKPRFRDILRESRADALGALDHSEPVTGSPHQLVIGALLGVCVVFLAALLGVQHPDTALQVALIAFVVAITLLVQGFIYFSFKFGPGLRKLPELTTAGLQVAALIVGEGLGTVAVLVGVLAVVWHFTPLAFWLSLVSYVVAFLAFVAVALVYGIMRAWREYQQQAKAGGTPPSAQGSPTPPAAE